MIKILHIGTLDSGGAGLGMINLHLAMLERGFDSKVLVLSKSTNYNSVYEAHSNINFFRPSSNKLLAKFQRALRRRGYLKTETEKIESIVRSIKAEERTFFTSPITNYDISGNELVKEADIINLHWISDFVDIKSFFKNVKKPIVWSMRDENPGLGGFHYLTNKGKHYATYKELEDNFLKVKRDAIIDYKQLSLVSLSDVMSDFVSNVDFLANKRNIKIYNCIDPTKYFSIEKTVAKKSLGLDNNCFVISFCSLSLGDLRKGFDILLTALRKLDIPNVFVLCVGQDDVSVKENNLLCLGTIESSRLMSLVYSASDVFVSPSLQESFGKTVVEALYCGTPVVSTPVGIAPEIIDDSNGVICHTADVGSLVEAIHKVHDRTYDRQRIRMKSVGLFSPDVIVPKYIDYYNETLNNNY